MGRTRILTSFEKKSGGVHTSGATDTELRVDDLKLVPLRKQYDKYGKTIRTLLFTILFESLSLVCRI